MAAVHRAEPQGQRAALAQGVDTGVPAVEATGETLAFEVRVRLAAENAEAPFAVERPVGTQHQAPGALSQSMVAVGAVESGGVTQALNPEPAVAAVHDLNLATLAGLTFCLSHDREQAAADLPGTAERRV